MSLNVLRLDAFIHLVQIQSFHHFTVKMEEAKVFVVAKKHVETGYQLMNVMLKNLSIANIKRIL